MSTRTGFLLVIAVICSLLSVMTAQTSDFYLSGRVKESITKLDLNNARVYRLDSLGNTVDSVRANFGYYYRGGAVDTLSHFNMKVPKVNTTYYFRITCDGHNPVEFDYTLEKLGKRERNRDLGTLYLDRAPHILKEVTVTSSKIKFYHKGDTIVYNADAFQLAEGSMLDALVAQLPGVELNNDGQIKFNGEFVESLLLNGKEFLDGNNNLMLENIAAYTVKNVEIYEGQSTKDKFFNDESARKILTMDVKLKKEYNIGWIINAQSGYGTEDRYMGRLFAMWFNPTTRVTMIGNANNLNDNRKPGRADTWTPEMMPSGKKEYQSGAIDYNYEDPDGERTAYGYLNAQYTGNRNTRTSERINFLPGGDTYENAFSRANFSETSLSSNHTFFSNIRSKNVIGGLNLGGKYTKTKNIQSDLSGAFNTEQPDMTMEILESIYTNAGAGVLESVINRSKTRTDGWTRYLSGSASTMFGVHMPKSNDRLQLRLGASYTSSKNHSWNDYNINYGADPTPAVVRRQYVDNTPNHTLDLFADASYRMSIKNVYVVFGYSYSHNDNVKDSYMYALERLNDMGIYGELPDYYTEAFDPANSYKSRLISNVHTIMPNISFSKRNEKTALQIYVRPDITFTHRHLDYWRNNRDYRLSKSNTGILVSSIYDAMIEYSFGGLGERNRQFRNSVRYSYRIDSRLPDMVDMLDIVDDSNPLNIYLGNPDLRTQYQHRHLLRWAFTPFNSPFQNFFYASYTSTTNALTRGYTYDTSTGVRYNRMYNVSGNSGEAVTNEISWQFGKTKQFTLSSSTDANFSNYSDMIGINLQEPELTKVRYRALSENLKLSWQIGSQSLQLRADYSNRHTTSSQAGFNTLNANHFNCGITGTFKLPKGFGITTDFTCYTRRGYGSPELDTTDPIWNVRLTYCPPRNSRWVFTVDGFDMLHKLSNVTYAVTASGRTVAYTNALPRYFLMTIQYRLNIQPKKR